MRVSVTFSIENITYSKYIVSIGHVREFKHYPITVSYSLALAISSFTTHNVKIIIRMLS